MPVWVEIPKRRKNPSTTTENRHYPQQSRQHIFTSKCVLQFKYTGCVGTRSTMSSIASPQPSSRGSIHSRLITSIATRRTGPSGPSSLSQPSSHISSISSINRPTSTISTTSEASKLQQVSIPTALERPQPSQLPAYMQLVVHAYRMDEEGLWCQHLLSGDSRVQSEV